MPAVLVKPSRVAAYLLLAAAGALAVALGVSLLGDIYRHQNGCQVTDGRLPASDVCQYVGLRVSNLSWSLLGCFIACLAGVFALVLRQRRP